MRMISDGTTDPNQGNGEIVEIEGNVSSKPGPV